MWRSMRSLHYQIYCVDPSYFTNLQAEMWAESPASKQTVHSSALESSLLIISGRSSTTTGKEIISPSSAAFKVLLKCRSITSKMHLKCWMSPEVSLDFKTGDLLWLCQDCPNSSSSYETKHDKQLQLGAKWNGVKSMVCFSEMLWLDQPKTSVCDNWGIQLLTHRIFNPFKHSHRYSWRIF